MSLKTNDTVTDNLQRAYKAVLLKIVRGLEKYDQEELRFYFEGLIIRGEPGALSILSCLQNAGKISWTDVTFLKEGLREVGRLDLEKILTEFEMKRNLTVLIDFYARKNQGMETSYQSAPDSVEKVAGYLLKLTRDVVRFDVSEKVRSLVESREGIKNLVLQFEKTCEQELSDPWSKLVFLVVIMGEIVAVVVDEHHRKRDATKLLSSLAEMFCLRILKLGSWEEFCNHVKKRFHLVYHKESSLSDEDAISSTVKKQIVDVVQHLKETTFFS